MARTVGTESLADLIERGALTANEPLIIRRRSKRAIEGKLAADGSIRVGDRTYATPSGAACAVLDVGSVDGWIRWRVPRLQDATLAEVRDG